MAIARRPKKPNLEKIAEVVIDRVLQHFFPKLPTVERQGMKRAYKLANGVEYIPPEKK